MFTPSPLAIFPIILLALVTVSLFNKLAKLQLREGGYQTLDGLRGYLAFSVFLHHVSFYYGFLLNGSWAPPASNVFEQFGQTSVLQFFMITSFLFYSKLMKQKGKNMDWQKFYIGRILRIYPLYLSAITIIFIIVAIQTNFTLREPFYQVIQECSKWVIYIEADINKFPLTWLIIAGVVWSLSYEWMFYCVLPFLGLLFLNIQASIITIILSGLFIYIFLDTGLLQEIDPILKVNSPFIIGIIAAILSKNEKIRHIASKTYVSFLLIPLIIIAYVYYPTIFSIIPYTCISIVFVAIACGNTLFGILTTKASRLLGQISYSIYLLHGQVLYITFHFVLHVGKNLAQPQFLYWLIIGCCTIALIIICTLTYKYIEEPGIDITNTVAAKIRNLFKKKPLVSPLHLFISFFLIYSLIEKSVSKISL